ncbi:creatininase family protein [Devosia sp. ZB163]|uniref:creatininase family protein n=1 Tax=Devosia sp. ZB163 TaxID=3025938 RepID=UPI00235EED19|nr:creatininase family protein [Devosia sp. ZB163]MDC9823701.1 creatininase family protein [Devosia sp. ZB163]
MTYRKIWWNDFSALDFHGLDPMKTIAVFPVAAIEQHGPHLPVGTDTIINQGHLDLLVERVPEDLDIRILPVQAVGKSNEHIWQKGTISGTATNLIEAWTQIGLEIARTGIRKVVFVNSHGGNVSMLDIVARELRVESGMLAVKAGWSHFWPKDIYSEVENRYGIHGGDSETSLVMHFRPELVQLDRLQDFPSVAQRDEQQYKYMRPTGMLSYAWIASDIHPKGAAGEASKATADKGRITVEAAVDGFIELLREVESYPVPDTA